jgi:hypothetical protein
MKTQIALIFALVVMLSAVSTTLSGPEGNTPGSPARCCARCPYGDVRHPGAACSSGCPYLDSMHGGQRIYGRCPFPGGRSGLTQVPAKPPWKNASPARRV